MAKDHDKAKADGMSLPAEFSQIVLDHAKLKYGLIPLASVWAKELRRSEEHRSLPTQELLEVAVRDIVSGKVTWESLKKLSKSAAAADEDEKGREKK